MATIRKVLCAVDFSPISEIVADYAKTVANSMDAQVVVMYAAPSLRRYNEFAVSFNAIGNFVKEIVSGAEERMEAFVADNFADTTVRSIVTVGYAPEEILKTASDEKADLIIIGTHGRRGVDRIVFGSVAEKVVKSSPVPVLTVRAVSG